MTYNIIVGTRPNFVKLSSFMREARKHPEHFRVIHTGQHYDDSMSKIFFEELEIREPDVILPNAPLGSMICEIRKHLGSEPVIVFGDTRSALAGGLAAEQNELIHIEAGLRSFDSRMPEETNRITIDNLSEVLFTSEQSANDNLLNEGIAKERIHYVGNLMLETLEYYLPVISKEKKGDHIVATIHRSENEANLKRILILLSKIKNVLLVAHPGTMAKIKDSGLPLYGVQILPSMGYLEFMKLVYSSQGVITDSGGLQEEASFLNIPCATLRDNTERPSTLSGSNKLFPLKETYISNILDHFRGGGFSHSSDFPDNNVAARIFKHL